MTHIEKEVELGYTLVDYHQIEVGRPSTTVSASSMHQPDAHEVLQTMFEAFGSRPFLLHHGQGFPQYVILNSCEAEEKAFKKLVQCVPSSEVRANAKSSLVIQCTILRWRKTNI